MLEMIVLFSLLGAQGQIVGVGEAKIENNDQVKARQVALQRALRDAVQKVVGFTIKSEFTSSQREVVKNNESQFNAKVEEVLSQGTEGFVADYKVETEKIQGDVLTLQVRANVFESKIQAKAKELAQLLAKAGNPKIMVVLQEVHIDPQGKHMVTSDSLVRAAIEKELISRGFELRGQRAASTASTESEGAYTQRLKHTEKLREIATKEGADVLIVGRINIQSKGKITDGPFKSLHGQERIEIDSTLRGLMVTTGDVISSKPVRMSSVGINLERAVYRAMQGRGKNLTSQMLDMLVEDLTSSFRKVAEKGRSYLVTLRGVKSFRREGKRFLSVLERLNGVSAARQKSFGKGELVVEVAFKGSSSQLQDLLFGAVENVKPLQKLDVVSADGNLMVFRL